MRDNTSFGKRRWSRALALITMALAGTSATSSAGVVVNYATAPGGNTYAVIADPAVSWSAAMNLSSSHGGYLATITSAAEQAFVEQLLGATPAPSGLYWIGLQKTSGDYGWTTGEALGYTNWLPGQPDNNGNNETVGSILWSNPGDNAAGTRGTWNDLPDPYVSSDSTYVDLNNGGYIAEYDGTRSIAANGQADNPVAVPLSPAIAIAPVGLALAYAAMRKARKGPPGA